jgi:hypothetical protein
MMRRLGGQRNSAPPPSRTATHSPDAAARCSRSQAEPGTPAREANDEADSGERTGADRGGDGRDRDHLDRERPPAYLGWIGQRLPLKGFSPPP